MIIEGTRTVRVQCNRINRRLWRKSRRRRCLLLVWLRPWTELRPRSLWPRGSISWSGSLAPCPIWQKALNLHLSATTRPIPGLCRLDPLDFPSWQTARTPSLHLLEATRVVRASSIRVPAVVVSRETTSEAADRRKRRVWDPLRSKYTYMDPAKRMRVAEPTLKAIHKQALLSYYERHAGQSSDDSKSQPPPALPRTMASSTSPTHSAKVHNKSK